MKNKKESEEYTRKEKKEITKYYSGLTQRYSTVSKHNKHRGV